VLWTSGTTGVPRGVTLSSQNLVGNAAAKLIAVPQSHSDRRLCVLPLSHAYARTCDFGTWLLSGCELAIAFGYSGLARLSPEFRPTLINVVPSLAERLLQDAELQGLDQLRLLGCGGAGLSEAAFDRWHARGVTVIQGYGLTEASPVICSATPQDARAGFVGRFVQGWESAIRDQQLFVRGPHVMLGYWNDPQATARRIDRDGWLATGDLVQHDGESGQLKILGRADDVIVLPTGKKIHPATVERSAEQVAGVGHAMLTYDRTLQLWFDAEKSCETGRVTRNLRELLDTMESLRGCELHRFDPPLRQELGELTAKGTICRNRILALRPSDQAGS
jgi:long-chain acyl-CoA synthetase